MTGGPLRVDHHGGGLSLDRHIIGHYTVSRFTTERIYSMTREIMGIITHTADETAAILGVTKRTLMNYTKTGKITGSKIGGKWVFTEQQIKDFINRGSVIDKG